jgi:hypothetical protein
MALDAELHVKVLSPDAVHGFNRPMAFLASHLFSDVALVVEENVFGQIIRLLPRRRGPGVIVAVLLQNLRVPGDDVLMAVQAFFHGWQSRMSGATYIRMAKLALNILYSGVHPMAEGYRLFHPDSHAR